MSELKKSYHHGDLRQSLQQAAVEIIRSGGIEALSMRKLADKVGVSRSAPYHHFADKHELLCAIAEQGFVLQGQAVAAEQGDHQSIQVQMRQFVNAYVSWAVDHPEYYNLMFGGDIWKSNEVPDTFKNQSHRYFRNYVERVEGWRDGGMIDLSVEPLRFAQVSWSTIHGLARLIIDGIYVDRKALQAMCDSAVDMFLASAPAAGS